MSESLGLINYGSDDEEVFIGRDLAHTRSYSERTAAEIDEEVKRIVGTCYKQAKALIEEHEDVLHRSAALLLEKEKITTEEFEALFAAEA
jgi:cell division protease FtsH